MSERDDKTRDRDGERDDDFDDPDAPASAEEIAASQRLRDALATAEKTSAAALLAGQARLGPEIELALSLRAAWDPSALSTDENRAVLDATPEAEELEAAVALRDQLDTNPLVAALRSAYDPRAIVEAEHRAIVEAALAKMPVQQKKGADVVVLRRRNVVRVAFGVVTGGLALAASIVLFVTQAPTRSHEAPLARARTTQPLFSEPFKAGETSARIDRIASARASDFRDNRFTKWGVR